MFSITLEVFGLLSLTARNMPYGWSPDDGLSVEWAKSPCRTHFGDADCRAMQQGRECVAPFIQAARRRVVDAYSSSPDQECEAHHQELITNSCLRTRHSQPKLSTPICLGDLFILQSALATPVYVLLSRGQVGKIGWSCLGAVRDD